MTTPISTRTRYVLVFLAILTGSLIQLVRGYRSLIVVIGFITFMVVGWLVVYLSDSKERALRRKKKREYYEG